VNRLTIAWRNVRRNRRRSLISGGLVAFGFASFALAGGFMAQSFDGLRHNAIRSGLGHIQFADARSFERSEETTLEFGITRAEQVIRTLASDPSTEAVMPRLEFFGLVTAGGTSIPYAGVGVDPEAEQRGSDIPKAVREGEWLRSGTRNVVLGRGLARLLNARLGDNLTLLATTPDGTLNAIDVTIGGIADIFIKELSERYLAVPLPLAQDLLTAPDTVSRISVFLREPAHERESAARMDTQLKAAGITLGHRLWSDLAVFYQQVRVLYIGIFGFMGTVLVVIVFLSTFNTTLMSVTERTREIGTLRALGARSRRIATGFVLEGALLGLASAVGGCLLSLLITLLVNLAEIRMPPPPGMAQGIVIHVQVIPSVYLLAALSMIATLAIASYFPARRAAHAPIVQSLAHV